MTQMSKSNNKSAQRIGLNGSVHTEVVAVFIGDESRNRRWGYFRLYQKAVVAPLLVLSSCVCACVSPFVSRVCLVTLFVSYVCVYV